MPGYAYKIVYELALDQFGYLNITQAEEAGVSPQALAMMTRRGDLERVSHGLYRVAVIPPTPLGPYMEATLWPSGVRGVLSHETALELYNLSDISPGKIHLTLPRRFRTHRDVPVLYVLHYADLDPEEIFSFEGISVTTVVRTIGDCANAHVPAYLLRQAMNEARRTGYLTEQEVASLRRKVLYRSAGTFTQ